MNLIASYISLHTIAFFTCLINLIIYPINLSFSGTEFACKTIIPHVISKNIVPYQEVPIPANQVNVTDYGATGDGITDDRKAIQDAIDDLASKGGGTILFNQGTYVVTGKGNASEGAIVLRDNIALLGRGMGMTVIRLQDNYNSDLTGIIRTPGTEANKNILIKDLTIDGNRNNNYGRVIGFYCGTKPGSSEMDENIQCIHVEIMNCEDYGFDPHERTNRLALISCSSHTNGLDGFTIDNCTNSLLQYCRAWNNDRNGFNVISNSDRISFEECLTFKNSGNGIILQNGTKNVTIRNCDIHNNLDSGLVISDMENPQTENNPEILIVGIQGCNFINNDNGIEIDKGKANISI